ncbi:hypothetical protein VTL71DRAFT_3710 [Oculimacula yallundae]|uniref:Major facilitator superfamily (MFS) profile domain-containing protein n=1 Tax=Oculimacula yallundae TaxID=86028 RepID=A0ABR4C3P9_9HELO
MALQATAGSPTTIGTFDALLPPGTVRLVSSATNLDEEATDSTVLVLSPVPSSDPNEPLNWSQVRKVVNYALVLAVTLASFTNVSIQTVFWQQMTVELGLEISQLSSGISVQLAGLAVGCLFLIPFTVKYGRRLTYLISLAVLASGSWWAARMNTYPEVLITNFIIGLACAINETAVQMTIVDLFFVHQRGSLNGLYFVAVMAGSFLTPMAAGAQANTWGWRSSYYTLATATTILFVIFVFAFEETKYVPISIAEIEVIISTPTKSEDDKHNSKGVDEKATELENIQSDPGSSFQKNSYRERMRLRTPTSESLISVFILPLHVITLPHVMFTALQFASGVAWLVLFLTILSVVFSAPPYAFNTAQIGMMGLGPFVGNAFGSVYGGPMADWAVMRLARRNGGLYEPEFRLYLLIIPAMTMAGGIIMFGVTADRGMHWIYPSIGAAFFAFGLGANGDITFTFVLDTYKELTAEAFVGIAFIRNAISIAIPFSMVPWLKKMGLSNMFILCGVLSFVVALLFVPMIIWGKRIRAALAPRYWRLVEKRMSLSL